MDETFLGKAQIDLLTGLLNRRSVRKFSSDPVPLDTIRELLKYGTYAPSACNFQGWRFIIITNEQIRESLINGGGGQVIRAAPVGILVLYENHTRNILYRDDIQSASACVQNILMAAYSMGLGACWICSLPSPSYVRRLLEIPRSFSPIAYVAVGYPAVEYLKKVPRRHSLKDLVGVNHFSGIKQEKGKNIILLWIEKFLILVYMKVPVMVKKRFLIRIVDSKFTKKFKN